MSSIQDDNLRGSVARYLETETLLGVRAAPLSAPRPASQSANPATGPAEVAASAKRRALSPSELAERRAALQALDQEKVKPCTKCKLSETRTNTVFGQGDPGAGLVFVGEAPGRDEDMQGLAFIGRAGQLLTKMIEAMGLSRDQVFICNILKCRPPNNRDPAPDEVSSCWPYLDEQLNVIKPGVIVALGKPAAQTLLRTTEGIGQLRGRWHDYYISGSPLMGEPTPLMPTYHPAYLLRSPGEKAKAWSDLKLVMQRLGLPIPSSR